MILPKTKKVAQEARIYAENIIDTVREPLMVLDEDLNVLLHEDMVGLELVCI